MHGRWIPLSGPRRFLDDMLHLAAQMPTVPVQRRMALSELVKARAAMPKRVCWPAIFLKAYAQVCDDTPQLRRVYVRLPWRHLREYPRTIANLAVDREYEGESCVFFGRIADPARLPLEEIHTRIRRLAEEPIDSVRTFRNMLFLARWPGPVRRALLWLGLNLPGRRAVKFGTFGLSVYSSLGAESLHPLSPLTTTLNYGPIDGDGNVWVRVIYDHRVFDGATAARALGKLEEVLKGPILAELRGTIPGSLAA